MSVETILLIVFILLLLIISSFSLIFYLWTQKNKKITLQNLPKTEEIKNTPFDDSKMNEHFGSLKQSLETIRLNTTSLSEIDEKISKITNIFINSKQRGISGEYIVKTVIEDILGLENNNIWSSQKSLPSGQIIDFVIKNSKDNKYIGIDSKFPLDNYTKIFNSGKEDNQEYKNKFKEDVKRMILDLKKYITPINKIESVLMFIPSEKVFFYILDEFDDLVSSARKNKIFISSPTNICFILDSVQQLAKEKELHSNSERIVMNLKKIEEEFSRWEKRWIEYSKSIDTLVSKKEQLEITNKKIYKNFETIFKNSNALKLEFNHEIVETSINNLPIFENYNNDENDLDYKT